MYIKMLNQMNNITEYSDIFDDEEQQYNMDEEEKHNEQDG